VTIEQQILSQQTETLQRIDRLLNAVAQVSTDTAALRAAAHNHSLTLLGLDNRLTQVQTAVNSNNITPLLASHATLATKVDEIMATIEQLQTAISASETEQGRIIALLHTQADSLAALSQQLADAIAGGNDPAALQAVVDKINADTEAMRAAADAHGQTPPPATEPTPTPV
jgi:chromosome segregation ATPase